MKIRLTKGLFLRTERYWAMLPDIVHSSSKNQSPSCDVRCMSLSPETAAKKSIDNKTPFLVNFQLESRVGNDQYLTCLNAEDQVVH